MAVADHFPSTYQAARLAFELAATRGSAWLETHAHPTHRGMRGELLATDVARFGPEDAESLLVVCSGTQGVEGFAGSGCQVGLVAEGIVSRRPASVAVLLIHAVNPYGYSFLRRVTEGNVDLNRNFQDFGAPLPANSAYEELHAALLPADWNGPARAQADAFLAGWRADRGMRAFQQAIVEGQYAHPDGMFFGGGSAAWANATVRGILRRHALLARRVAVIDIHTGLGDEGYGQPISVDAPGDAAFLRARQWWGDDVRSVHGIAQDRASSPPVTGSLIGAVAQEAPGAEVTAIALEYGTVPLMQVFDALRADNWLYARGLQSDIVPDSALAREVREGMRSAFLVDTGTWKDKVFTRAAELVGAAYRGLTNG